MSPAFGKRRALGQHFLRDPGVIQKITDTVLREAQGRGCQSLLEVGPGRGAITEPLLEALEAQTAAGIQCLILAERDRDLAAQWREKSGQRLPGSLPLQVEEGDFLELPEDRWLNYPPLAVASNLPYSAGTAILTRLARHPQKIAVMVLMFQAEVAARLRATPETKAWGSLSVWIQNQWEVSKLCAVRPGAFAPPPDVDSEVVVLLPRAQPQVLVRDPQAWEALLKACFAHRRKMLRSGLPLGPYREALARSGVNPELRAEALNWQQWRALYEALD